MGGLARQERRELGEGGDAVDAGRRQRHPPVRPRPELEHVTDDAAARIPDRDRDLADARHRLADATADLDQHIVDAARRGQARGDGVERGEALREPNVLTQGPISTIAILDVHTYEIGIPGRD